MSRGNRQDDIFLDDQDNRRFLETLQEACERTGWIIHAYVLMRNHYHLLLETPEPNLVDGMRWLQGTYTKRFNARHKQWGHLLQGRYKALLIDPELDYFRTVGDYIHLNPARARCFDLKTELLESYIWSSFPHYLTPTCRPDWLCVDRLFGAHGVVDDPSGRAHLSEAMQFRIQELSRPTRSENSDPEWALIRQGWAYGQESFKKELQTGITARAQGHHRSSYSGDAIKKHDQHEAHRIFLHGLSLFDLSEERLPSLKKSDPRKKVIAWRIRTSTSVHNQWISKHLCMGNPSNLSRFYKEVAETNEGFLFELKCLITKK